MIGFFQFPVVVPLVYVQSSSSWAWVDSTKKQWDVNKIAVLLGYPVFHKKLPTVCQSAFGGGGGGEWVNWNFKEALLSKIVSNVRWKTDQNKSGGKTSSHSDTLRKSCEVEPTEFDSMRRSLKIDIATHDLKRNSLASMTRMSAKGWPVSGRSPCTNSIVSSRYVRGFKGRTLFEPGDPALACASW